MKLNELLLTTKNKIKTKKQKNQHKTLTLKYLGVFCIDLQLFHKSFSLFKHIEDIIVHQVVVSDKRLNFII